MVKLSISAIKFIYHCCTQHAEKGKLTSIPLYLHCRAYYMRTRWAPYSAVSLGGRLVPKDCGVYFDCSTGVEGYSYERKSIDEYDDNVYCGSQACPYNHENHYHIEFHNIFSQKEIYGGTSFRLGISF